MNVRRYTTWEWVLHSTFSFLFMWQIGHFYLWEMLLIAVAVGCFFVATGFFP